jgi:tRNA-splicing ligase RtcB
MTTFREIDGIAVFGRHEDSTLQQMRAVSRHTAASALMADAHHGYVMPVGGVAAYREQVSVMGVGVDIACGNAAIRTNHTIESLGDTPERHAELSAVADEIQSTISFGMGRRNRADDAPVDDPLFGDPAWRAVPGSKKEVNALKTKARQQLGTVGGGNHYVDVFADETGALWVGVHFGSRGLGHTIAQGFSALGQGKRWGERVAEREVLLDLSTPLGDDYWQLMHLAGRYAYAGREWVARKVVQLLGARELELVHNHHNYAWRETHDGEELIVVRKGATPAFPGSSASSAARWATTPVILRGRASDDAAVRTPSAARSRAPCTAPGACSRAPPRREAQPQDRGGHQARRGDARDDGRLDPREGGDPARRWARREPARLPPAAGGARGAGRHHRHRAHAAAARRRHGGGGRVRPIS